MYSFPRKSAVTILGLLAAAWFEQGESKIESLVEVYDNVLDPETAHWLHDECVAFSQSDELVHDETWLSLFPLEDPERHSPIQQLLDKIMREMYPDVTEPTYHIEFWSRSQWSHILAHQDMDETHQTKTAEQPSIPVRTPETGQVLYLKLGKKVRGPTVVWNTTRGGDLMDLEPGTFSEMISVPAVEGRLLRFQGNLLHGVPRPYDVYWNDVFELEEDPEYERSVLLFNTWRANETIIDSQLMEPVLSEEDAKPIPKSCHPKSEWKPVEVTKYPIPEQSWLDSIFVSPFAELEVPMMGNERRRGMKKRSALLDAPKGAADALSLTSQVTSIPIRPTRLRILGVELDL